MLDPQCSDDEIKANFLNSYKKYVTLIISKGFTKGTVASIGLFAAFTAFIIARGYFQDKSPQENLDELNLLLPWLEEYSLVSRTAIAGVSYFGFTELVTCPLAMFFEKRRIDTFPAIKFDLETGYGTGINSSKETEETEEEKEDDVDVKPTYVVNIFGSINDDGPALQGSVQLAERLKANFPTCNTL